MYTILFSYTCDTYVSMSCLSTDIDSVILATGYKISFPFLDNDDVIVEGNHAQLYLYMFPPGQAPPTEAPPTLAVIGCVQAGGALGPVSEMQSRLAVQVFKVWIVGCKYDTIMPLTG